MKTFVNRLLFAFSGIVIAMFLSPLSSTCIAGKVSEAEQFYNAMSPEQFLEPIALDDFIRRYPESDHARLLFAVRFDLLQRMPSIEGYNDFIEKYSDKLLSQYAIQEVFKLYREQDSVIGYLDFIERYPNSQQALVAQLRVQELLFEYACILDKVEEYNAFFLAFPDAPQAEIAKEKAKIKAFENEQKIFDEHLKQNPNLDYKAIENFALDKIVDWEMGVDNVCETAYSDNDLEVRDKLMLIKQRSFVLQKVYKEYIGDRVTRKLDFFRINDRLAQIDQRIKSNHEEILEKMDEQTQAICKGLEQLNLDNRELIQTLQVSFKEFHKEIKNVNIQLSTANKSLANLNYNVVELHKTAAKSFNRLDMRLNQVNQSLIKVNNSICAGFYETNKTMCEEFYKLDAIVYNGLQQVHKDHERISEDLSRNTAAIDANTGALIANTDATNANTSATNANTSATNKNTEAVNNNTGATMANTEAVNNNTGATMANTQAVNNNTGATMANTDATNANTKATIDNTGATRLNTIVTLDNTDAVRENTGALKDNTGAARLNTIVTLDNTDAVRANGQTLQEIKGNQEKFYGNQSKNNQKTKIFLEDMNDKLDYLKTIGEAGYQNAKAQGRDNLAGKTVGGLSAVATGAITRKPKFVLKAYSIASKVGKYVSSKLHHRDYVKDLPQAFEPDKKRKILYSAIDQYRKIKGEDIPQEYIDSVHNAQDEKSLNKAIDKLSRDCGIPRSALNVEQ